MLNEIDIPIVQLQQALRGSAHRMPNTTRRCADGSPPGSALIALACHDTSSCSSSAVTAFSSSVTTCATAPLALQDTLCAEACAAARSLGQARSATPVHSCRSSERNAPAARLRRRQATARAWLQGRCGSACRPKAPASCSAGSSGPPPNAAAAAAAPPGPGSVAAAAAMALRRCFRDAQCRS